MKGFYHVPKEFKEDILNYKDEIERFLKGEVRPTEFRALRVPRGCYEQRTENTFMLRIRIPAGGVTPEQMETIAELSQELGNGILHVTTRQDIQIHWIDIENTQKGMEKLFEVDLTTKGGGGNTVRNITACFDSGVCEREAFDVTQYAVGITEHLIKDPRSYTLPRKFKISFSGCSKDCAYSTVNDLGFIAAIRKNNGRDERGFRVYVAGGMGTVSRVGDLLEEFVPENEIVYVAEAIKNLFDKKGNRKNKHKARLRFLMEKLGYKEFKRQYQKELDIIKDQGQKVIEIKEYPRIERSAKEETNDYNSDMRYRQWIEQNVTPQKQNDYFYVIIKLYLGDISSERLMKLAEITRNFGEGSIRTNHEQNFVLRWVHKSELPFLYKELRSAGIDAIGGGTVKDILCCTGAATCKLGICLSRGLTEAVVNKLETQDDIFGQIKDVKIKISGCPNSCGHHPIGAIGLHGAARRYGTHLVPSYNVMLGGRVEEGKTALGEAFGFVPAKNIPELIESFLRYFLEERRDDEDFYAYLDRIGKERMKRVVSSLSTIPEYEENRDFYIDWSSNEEFSLAGRGPGECGAGVFDLIELDLEDANNAVKKAEEILQNNLTEDVDKYLYEAVNRASRALLVTRGLEPKGDLEAFDLFEKEFINKGYIPERFKEGLGLASGYNKGWVKPEAMKENKDLIRDMAKAVVELYESMDDSLTFHAENKEETDDLETTIVPESIKSHVFMDLRGVACPMNYIKAKLRLEEMEIGQILEMFLDEGEPIRNVPASLSNDGQDIKIQEKIDEYYRLVVEKKVG
ncbi:MAG: sulfurtransferase TusA family protein [Nitrospirota bacterium]